MTRSQGGIVVTGASSGIGQACALHLDRLGFQVFAGVLPGEDAETIRSQTSERLRHVPLDVTNADSIAAAAQMVEALTGARGLAGLVNNAGICVSGPLEFLPTAALREQFEVNVFGQMSVTQAFMPLLRNGHGRIVVIGSVAAGLPFPLSGPYAASKSALNTLTAVLRVELSPWNIPVSLVVPGGIATPIWERAAQRRRELVKDLPAQARELYGLASTPLLPALAPGGDKRLPPAAVASVVAHALTTRHPKPRYLVGSSARLVGSAMSLPLVERLLDWWIIRTVRRRGHAW